MSGEADFIAVLRRFATHPAARALADDVAVLGDLVLTKDMLVEGVHYRAGDAPEDVAWKLVAVNLSDLAAKGATPLGVLLGFALGDAAWDARFAAGLQAVLAEYSVPLLGGDTVAGSGVRTLSLTALGRAPRSGAPSRSGARAGDALWVTGSIGAGGLGLAGDPAHLEAYLRPRPLLAEGQALAPLVNAMMDVSDGLLIDAARMAEASGLALEIDLDAVPMVGDRMAAVTAGDDYQLLFAAPPTACPPVAAARIGRFDVGHAMTLIDRGGPVALPGRLGWAHG